MIAEVYQYADFIAACPERRACLEAVAALDLPDGWIGAGFLRNPVWDRLHDFAAPTPLNDIDVVYFDPEDPTVERDAALEARLRDLLPGRPWSVRNQARMHHRNGDRPYRSTADALTYWLETPTALAMRRATGGGLELLAPFGLGDLYRLEMRPTPHARAHRLSAYQARLAKDQNPIHLIGVSSGTPGPGRRHGSDRRASAAHPGKPESR